MERGFPHPRGIYHGRGAGLRFPGADMPHESSWVGRPLPPWSHDCVGPQWDQGPPDPSWGYPNPHWDHLKPQRGQGHHNSQCYPVPGWNQNHPELQSRDFHNGNFLPRGSRSYRRCSQGRFYGKCYNGRPFYKGSNSPRNSSHLVEVQKKKNDTQVRKSESAIPKKTEQEDSVASVKNSDPPQASEEARKATITPSQFSFHLSPDSLMSSPAKREDTELEKKNDTQVRKSESAIPKKKEQEDSVASVKNSDPPQASEEASKAIITPSQFSFRLSPDSLMSSPAKREDTELVKVGTCPQTEGNHKVEDRTPEETSKLNTPEKSLQVIVGTHPQTEGNHEVENQTPEETSKLQATLETLELKKEEEEIELVHLGTCQRTQVHCSLATTPLSAKAPAAKQAPSETIKDVFLAMKEEPLMLESSQPTDHFNHVDSLRAVEIPFLSETTDECQAKEKEGLEQTQMGGIHEDKCHHTHDAEGAGSFAVPAIPSNASSVPVLVRGNNAKQPYYWAPEDYQEPTWSVDEAKQYDDVSKSDRHLILSHSALRSCHSCDRNPSTGDVLNCHSSSEKSHHSSDSNHSGTQRATQDLHFHCRSPLRQDCHSRSPLQQSRHSRSPLRGRENSLWTHGCCKCHCKCPWNSPRERFCERPFPSSYSTYERHCHCHSKESSKSYRTSHSYSSYNSITKRKRSKYCKETKKEKSSSVKRTKSSKIKKRKNVQAHVNHDAALPVETSISSETTENFQPTNTEESELVQLATSSEDKGFPHQSCAGKESGISASSRIMEDPRSVAVLTRRNQIEQDYLLNVLNFAAVAAMLLQKEPSMEQALEVALRATMRSVGDYYESMLKNFIDDYDLPKTD